MNIKKEQKSPAKQRRNIYKLLFFLLVLVVLVCFLVLIFNNYSNKRFIQGVDYTVYSIFDILEKEGKVALNFNNKSVVLVSEDLIHLTTDNLIREIIETVEKQGHVYVYNNETELLLVPSPNNFQ